MNFTQFWISSCFLVISHIQLNFQTHLSKLKILIKIFSFTRGIHCSGSGTNILFLTSNFSKFDENWQTCFLTLKTHGQAFESFLTLIIFGISSRGSSSSLSLMDGEASKVDKISFTHLNLNP